MIGGAVEDLRVMCSCKLLVFVDVINIGLSDGVGLCG